MIKVDWPLFLKRFGVFLGIIIAIVSIQTYISNQVSTRTQFMQELCEKEKADIQLNLEQRRLEEKAKLEKEIVELKSQLEKAKILLDKIEQQKTYSTLIKKDVKKFMTEFDNMFGVQGKKDDK